MEKKDVLPPIGALVLLLFIFSQIYYGIKVGHENDARAYEAWVKYTGNGKNLTLKEWKLLKRRKLLHYHEVENGNSKFH